MKIDFYFTTETITDFYNLKKVTYSTLDEYVESAKSVLKEYKQDMVARKPVKWHYEFVTGKLMFGGTDIKIDTYDCPIVGYYESCGVFILLAVNGDQITVIED